MRAPPLSLFRLTRGGLVLAGACLLLLPALPAAADVLTTRDGLRIEGTVEKQPDGTIRVETGQGAVFLDAEDVAAIERGTSPRTDLKAAFAALPADDAAAAFRFALQADDAGFPDLARVAYARVIEIEADHLAARRALGYEKVGDQWLRQDEALREKGMVLFDGAWLLPAQIEHRSKDPVRHIEVPRDADRIRSVIRTLATGEPALREAARRALAQTPGKDLLAVALDTLYDRDPQVRIASARLLADVGDEAALRPLIFSAVRDADADARAAAVLAADSFGHEDTAVPFVRALASQNLRIAANAAQALGALGDKRVVGYIVKRMRSAGSSARSFVAFLNQVSYVRDYDVEIAQASNIANPDVATLTEGVVLDTKILGAVYTKTWIEPILADAAGEILGMKFETPEDLVRWYAAHKDDLPAFPDEGKKRAPRRQRKGRVIGAPVTD